MSKRWKKITECSCVQTFDGDVCLSQELVAANNSDYEDMDGKMIDCPSEKAYMPFVMDQPERESDYNGGLDFCFQGWVRGADITALIAVGIGEALAIDDPEFANLTKEQIIAKVTNGIYAVCLIDALNNCAASEIEIHDVEVKE